jgi:hypothetical protein
MFGSLFGSKESRPTDDERTVAARVLAALQEQVFCGPGDGEIELTGDMDADSVTNFRWMHAKAAAALDELLATRPPMSDRLSASVQRLHRGAARTAEMLAPPVAKMSHVRDDQHAELAEHMKAFLEEITVLGDVVKGKRWK